MAVEADDDLTLNDPVGALVLAQSLRMGHVPLHDSPYTLVDENDPILLKECEPFDFTNPIVDPYELTMRMSETMLAHNGIGLAAPQVGILTQVFVLRANPIIAVFNPRIVDASSEMRINPEGCLSFPGLAIKVKRAAKVRVRYQQPNREIVTREFAGLTARAFQHEYDHLYGILFTRRASLFHRQQAYRQRVKV